MDGHDDGLHKRIEKLAGLGIETALQAIASYKSCSLHEIKC